MKVNHQQPCKTEDYDESAKSSQEQNHILEAEDEPGDLEDNHAKG